MNGLRKWRQPRGVTPVDLSYFPSILAAPGLIAAVHYFTPWSMARVSCAPHFAGNSTGRASAKPLPHPALRTRLAEVSVNFNSVPKRTPLVGMPI
jgi:hypothetical protein